MTAVSAGTTCERVSTQNKLTAVTMSSSHTREALHSARPGRFASITSGSAQRSATITATDAYPANFPKKYVDLGAGSDSSSSVTLSLDSRTMLVTTNMATMNTAAILSGAAISADWISRVSAIATWLMNCASPKARTTTLRVNHSRRFLTASIRVTRASETTMDMSS